MMACQGCQAAEINALALELTQYFAYDATMLIPQSSLSSLLFGVLTVLAVASIFLLVHRRSSSTASIRIPLFSTIVLFVSTAVYMAALVWHHTSVTRMLSQATGGIFSETYNGVESLASLEAAVLKQSWMATIALGINIIVGDAIVWWRACIVWRRKAINYIGVTLLALTIVLGAIALWRSYTSSVIDLYLMFSGSSAFANAAAALSLATNVLATSLIGYKAWGHWRFLKSYLGAGGSKTRVLRVLALLVESGGAYCSILVFILAYQLNHESARTFSNAGFYFVYGCLVPTVAIYPISIIVLIALSCSPLVYGLSESESVEPKRDYDQLHAMRLNPRAFCHRIPQSSRRNTITLDHTTRWSALQSLECRIVPLPSESERGDRDSVRVNRMSVCLHQSESSVDVA